MDKRILHVFPDRKLLIDYLERKSFSNRVVSINKAADYYREVDGTVHHCKAIRSRDDVLDLLGYVFTGFEKHGDFGHLIFEDGEYVDYMIASRVRKEAS